MAIPLVNMLPLFAAILLAGITVAEAGAAHRSYSAPARLRQVADAALDVVGTQWLSANTRARRPSTLGTPWDPASYADFSRLHRLMRFTLLRVNPCLKVEFFMSTFYVMVDLHPVVSPGIPVLRPSLWHCTLLRAKLPYADRLHVDDLVENVRAFLMPIWDALGPPIVFQPTMPPWKKSWNFGLDDVWTAFALALTHSAMKRLYELAPRARAELRELHVSWN